MASNAQVMKKLERLQARMHESENNMDVMVATPQAIFKDIPKEDGQKPHNEGREGDAKGMQMARRKRMKGKLISCKPIPD